MKEYKATLIVESVYFEAEDHEEAEQTFWDVWHNNKDTLNWELVVTTGNIEDK